MKIFQNKKRIYQNNLNDNNYDDIDFTNLPLIDDDDCDNNGNNEQENKYNNNINNEKNKDEKNEENKDNSNHISFKNIDLNDIQD